VVALLWVVLAAAAAFAFLRPGAGSTDLEQVETTTVVVEAGDTMWALASSVDSEEDPRAVVDAIVELNGLRSGADIRAGDVLIVPVAGDE
jgi:nucleoid-associated protein YgaU